ncbi:condensation domain-containing protein [Actinophytocola sp.]|uniref:condensation domain-containing protein n=1 Tax=Actinophytocola sp. TaxID=1872138 RepID=UPI002D75811F|nr:condensation domain-containing protein [Actinophytocola sp.]HYQ66221.1 condensation domain-containing protein [Actinophytocola sp.]
MDTITPTRPTGRRRVQLTPLPSVPVAFTGHRSAVGPLTLGQLNIMHWFIGSPDHPLHTMWTELEMPAGLAIADVVETVGVLLARHESLRTHFLVDGGHPRQSVAGDGVLMLEVCHLGGHGWGQRDQHVVAEALGRWMYGRDQAGLGLTRPALRVAVAIAPGEDGRTDQIIACVAGISHLAVDDQGVRIVRREFAELARDRSARRVGERYHQPLDQVAVEAVPAARRQAERALCHWQDQLERMPHLVYVPERGTITGESLAVELWSTAAAMAVRRVAARTRGSRSSIVLAALCAVLAQRTGLRELVFPVISSNRFERHLARYVGTLAQSAAVTVEVGAGGFDALARHAWASVIEGSRHGRYDVVKRAEIADRIAYERGLCFNYDPVFNNIAVESRSAPETGVLPDPDQISAAVRRTELRWRPLPGPATLVRFDLHQVDDVVRLDGWSADNGLVPRAELESLLLAVERLLVAAARADLDTDGIRAAVGLEPIPRGPDWLLVDRCWVDLVAVQRLLDEALAPGAARIFPSVDGEPLVAYLTAGESADTPERAHARCMAALPRHPTAITPRRYVVCRAAPAQPQDPFAWQEVLGSGTGRALTS